MKHDLTTGTWQDDTGCPISIVLAATSDALDHCLLYSSLLVVVIHERPHLVSVYAQCWQWDDWD